MVQRETLCWSRILWYIQLRSVVETRDTKLVVYVKVREYRIMKDGLFKKIFFFGFFFLVLFLFYFLVFFSEFFFLNFFSEFFSDLFFFFFF